MWQHIATRSPCRHSGYLEGVGYGRAAVTSLTGGVVIVVVIAHRLGIIVVRALVADRVNGRLTVVHRLQAHTPSTGHVTNTSQSMATSQTHANHWPRHAHAHQSITFVSAKLAIAGRDVFCDQNIDRSDKLNTPPYDAALITGFHIHMGFVSLT